MYETTPTTEHLIEQVSLSELRSKNRSHRATQLTIFLTQLAQIYLFTERSLVGVISYMSPTLKKPTLLKKQRYPSHHRLAIIEYHYQRCTRALQK